MAVDRGNEKVAYLHEPYHPAVLRLVQRTIDNGRAAGIPVGMCGEMAADPASAIVLLGLGLDEFSMSSAAIPAVKRAIRSMSLADAKEVAGAAMALSTSSEVAAYLSSRLT
jgi:phosphotransferase system enzyme I (PtsI)